MDAGEVRFANRREAGRLLADRLAQYAKREDVIVLGLPRGGVPVAYEIASALQARLDVFICRKLGLPSQEELAIGAIASGGIRVLHEELATALGVSAQDLEVTVAKEEKELERRERLYRGGIAPLVLRDRIVILVDDGIATGSTMEAALLALRHLRPAKIVVAVPVAPPSSLASLRSLADEVVCITVPESLYAISQFYEDFNQLTDEEVLALLTRYRAQMLRAQ